MYSLLTGLVRHLTRKEEFSVIILGLDNAGKTSYLEKVKSIYNDTPGLPPEKISPTTGQNIGRINLASTILQFWDLGGREDLQPIWTQYYEDCHAVCFIIDSSTPERLQECWTVFDKLIREDGLKGVPILVLANKQDRENHVSLDTIKEDVKKRVEGTQVSQYNVLPISALKGDGCKESVEWLLGHVAIRDGQEDSD